MYVCMHVCVCVCVCVCSAGAAGMGWGRELFSLRPFPFHEECYWIAFSVQECVA